VHASPALVAQRRWEDYAIGRADAIDHMRALNETYGHVIESHGRVIGETETLDPVTQDRLGRAQQLELFQWFGRGHLEGPTRAADRTRTVNASAFHLTRTERGVSPARRATGRRGYSVVGENGR